MRLSPDEFLHDLQLIITTSLESEGVVENIAIMSFENEFVIDIVEPTLQPRSSRFTISCRQQELAVQPQLKVQVEPD